MRYYDFSVRVLPEGADSSTRMSLHAARWGYTGIAIVNLPSFQTDARSAPGGADVYPGVMIEAENVRKLRGRIGSHRSRTVVLAVRGGSDRLNRAAVEDRRVDILSHPLTKKGGGLNHVLARAAAKNRVAVEFDLGHITRDRGGSRVRALTGFRRNLELCRKYGAPMLLTSGALSRFDIRAPREMMAIAGLFGMTHEEAEQSLSSVPEEILLCRMPPEGQVIPGVEVLH